MCREFLFCWLIQWRCVFWIRNSKVQPEKKYFLSRLAKIHELWKNDKNFVKFQAKPPFMMSPDYCYLKFRKQEIKKNINVYFLIRTYLCCSANNFFFLALAICLALPFLLSKCVFIEKLWLRWFVGRDEFAREAKRSVRKRIKFLYHFHGSQAEITKAAHVSRARGGSACLAQTESLKIKNCFCWFAF